MIKLIDLRANVIEIETKTFGELINYVYSNGGVILDGGIAEVNGRIFSIVSNL